MPQSLLRFLTLFAAFLATAATSGHDDGESPAGLFDRVVLIGASATAGYGAYAPVEVNGEVIRRPINMAHIVDAALPGAHEPIRSHASFLFFTRPHTFGPAFVRQAREADPTLVIAVDFLFWYGYGIVGGADQTQARLDLLERGLALVDSIEAPVVVGDFPDMSKAVGFMLTARQMPSPDALEALNDRLYDWAGQRDNVVVMPLAEFTRDLTSGAIDRIGPYAWPPEARRDVLQPDHLHPTLDGLIATVQSVTESLAAHYGDDVRDGLDLDRSAVRTRVIEAVRPPAPPAMTGFWRINLRSPGGDMPFLVEIEKNDDGHRGWVINGEEREPIPRITTSGRAITLHFDHYDASVRLEPLPGTGGWRGVYRKTAATADRLMAAAAEPADPPAEVDPDAPDRAIDGRWLVHFSSSDDPAVGVFDSRGGGRVDGTFLTTTGDYRYLSGAFDEAAGVLELSCFDGAHAFLFRATLESDGRLAGEFWSGAHWRETWRATRDEDAALPDAFTTTRANPDVDPGDIRGVDLDGAVRSLTDPAFTGKARIIEVFGSWCPNCNDASRYLKTLHERYADDGLSILAVAFEVTGDEERDLAQLRRYRDHHALPYPILLMGPASKDAASQAFPLVDRVRSYPTFVFLDARNEIRAVYTGFSGPATGAAHDTLRRRFETTIEELLGLR